MLLKETKGRSDTKTRKKKWAATVWPWINERILEYERARTRSHTMENSIDKRPWTFRKTEYRTSKWMIEWINEYTTETSSFFAWCNLLWQRNLMKTVRKKSYEIKKRNKDEKRQSETSLSSTISLLLYASFASGRNFVPHSNTLMSSISSLTVDACCVAMDL